MNKYKSLTISLLIISAFSNSCQQDQVEPSVVDEYIEPPLKYKELNTVFPIDKVTDVKFEISTSEWNRLLTNYDINSSNQEYIAADFSITEDNITTKLDGIGIRIRGNTSRNRPEGTRNELHNPTNPDWRHASFSASLKEYRKSQRYKGVKKIDFKWFKDDANYVRELYCYDLFERFGVWTAPHSSYSTLTIKIKEDQNAAYFGVYHMVESIDENYLKSREQLFGSYNGNLWKCSSGADLKYIYSNGMGVENVTLDPKTSQTYIYDLKTNKENIETAKAQLTTFITELNSKSGAELKTWLQSRMDVDFFLRTYAVNVMVGSWDDYWHNRANYYIYFDQNNQFYFIPYDYDNTLGTSAMWGSIPGGSGTRDLLNWGSDACPLVAKILTIPEFKTIYVNYLYDLADPANDYFYSGMSIPRIENWQAMVQPYVSNDTGEDMEIGDRPAYWADQPQYRLNSLTNNFFVIRQTHLPPRP